MAYNAQEQLYEGTVVIPEDELFVDLELVPHDDTYLELAEDVTLRVVEQPGSPWNAGVWYVVPPEGSEATVTIEDNDEAQVYALTYGGATAQYITTDPAYVGQYAAWPVNTLISADHWFDADAAAELDLPPGCPAARYLEDRAFPVSYRRSSAAGDSRMRLTTEFLRRPEPGYRMYVRGFGPDGIEMPWVAASAGDEVSSAVLDSQAIPNSIQYYEDFLIQWDYSVTTDDQFSPDTWNPAGTSSNEVDLTWATPTVTPLYHSVVYLGVKNADGIGGTNPTPVVNVIWSEFTDLDVRRRDATLMYYYGNHSTLNTSTVELLGSADGQCHAWASLLHDVLGVQGISSTIRELTPLPVPGNIAMYFAVHNTLDGQGHSNPPFQFVRHFVVDFAGALYDPSYGADHSNLTQWEDACLDYIRYLDLSVGSYWDKPNTTVVADLEIN